MAAADTILVLEILIFIAMVAVWAIHLWGSRDLKNRLSGLRHRLFDGHLMSGD